MVTAAVQPSTTCSNLIVCELPLPPSFSTSQLTYTRASRQVSYLPPFFSPSLPSSLPASLSPSFPPFFPPCRYGQATYGTMYGVTLSPVHSTLFIPCNGCPDFLASALHCSLMTQGCPLEGNTLRRRGRHHKLVTAAYACPTHTVCNKALVYSRVSSPPRHVRPKDLRPEPVIPNLFPLFYSEFPVRFFYYSFVCYLLFSQI